MPTVTPPDDGRDPARRTSPRLSEGSLQKGGPPAATAWALLAPHIAGRPWVRVSRDGGRSYPARSAEPLTTALPTAPAAVLLFDDTGAARCLAADFDVARGGAAQVDRDAAGFAELVDACGGRSFADRSPSGGRHVYVLWAQARPVGELRSVLDALRMRFPSLDITPMTNPRAGCIRPPGARHRHGGHQTLTVPLSAAQDAISRPCGPEVWNALLEALTPELDMLRAVEDHVVDDGASTRPDTDHLSPRIERIATTGLYDTNRYRSQSEARQAVVTAAAAAGWSFAALATRVENGSWPGLAHFYNRYRPGQRRTALVRDWRKSSLYLSRGKTAHKCATRGSTHTGGGSNDLPEVDLASQVESPDHHGPAGRGSVQEYEWIRSWWDAVLACERTRWAGRGGLCTRLLLRALGAMAQRRGSRYLDVGRRSLALACGPDDATVSRLLRQLRDEPDPVLVLIESDRGIHGDLYELRIPDSATTVASWRSTRGGRIDAIHPVFRELGATRALVYEVLTTQPAPRRAITDTVHLPARTVDDALRRLAEHGLAQNDPAHGWRRGPVSPDHIAAQLGVPELVDALIAEYAVERAAWQALLGAAHSYGWAMAADAVFAESVIVEDRWWEHLTDPPPDPDQPAPAPRSGPHTNRIDTDRDPAMAAAVALLRAELGAELLTDPDDLTDTRYGIYPPAPDLHTTMEAG